MSPVPNHKGLSEVELREFEEEVSERFEAIADRYDDRLDRIEQQLQAWARSTAARCVAVDRQVDAARTDLEQVQVQLVAGIDVARRDLAQTVLLGLLGTIVSTAGLCLATLLLAR
jgi:hypothetical protein